MTYRNGTRYKALRAAVLASGALIASGALMAQLAHADTASESSETALGEIVVTAQKRVQSINDVGLTITAIGNDELERQGVKSLGDLADQVPGLNFAPTDLGTPVFTLRGVGFYDNSIGNYGDTSVYVDEVALPFPVYTTHANLDLERVEVLKGPQGTLFGENSTGGAINYIAAKPTDTFSAGANATLGRFDQGDVDGYVSGPLTDTLRARLAVEHDSGGDWQHSYTRTDFLGAKDVTNARLLLDWRPTDDLKLLLNLNGWQDKSDPQAGQFIAYFPTASHGATSAVNPAVAAFPFAPNDPTAADWAPDQRPRSDQQQYQAALRADYNVTHTIVLTSITSYINYQVNKALDMDGTSTDLFEYSDVGSAKSVTQELRVAGGEGTRFHWVGGGNYEGSHTTEAIADTYFDQTPCAVLGVCNGDFYVDQRREIYAAFANGAYDLLSNLTLNLGARYTREKDTANECTTNPPVGGTDLPIIEYLYSFYHPGVPFPATAPGDCLNFLQNGEPGRFIDTLEEHNISWRAGLDYKVTPDVLLYVNVAKGFKGGAFPAIPSTTYAGYLPVQQESLLDYEGGFKATLFNRKLQVNGAAFYYDYTNKQLLTKFLDPILGNYEALANVPKSVVKGAELEVTAVPIEGLHLSGGITYLDAVITNYVGINAAAVEANFAGTPIPFTPKWQYVLNADYDIPFTGEIRPFIGASLTGRTDTTSIVGNLDGLVLKPGYRTSLPLDDVYDLPAYHLVDLRAGVQAPDGTWRVMAWAKNVFNTYYWLNVAPASEAVDRYAGQPRTYGVTVSYRFK